MFSSRRERLLENHLALLRSEISDLRQALRDERADFAAQRQELLDQLLALAQPAAHRELHPRPRLQVEKDEKKPKRIHFPGYQRSLRPPEPASPLGPDFEADVVAEAPTDGDAVTG